MLPLFVYSASDFIGGLPVEQSSAAAGNAPFTLTLRPDAQPVRILVNDDDGDFGEVDATQSLLGPATINGTAYAAGTTIHTAYDLINSSTGLQVTSFHLGGDGYQQGEVAGIVATSPLEPGQSYTFDQERTSFNQPNAYDRYVTCFAAGTSIDTEKGPVAVEDLQRGDRVRTLDGRFVPLRASLCRHVSASELRRNPRLRPVRIAAGAMGAGLPRRDLVVSPQHRMVVASPVARRMFGSDEVLVAATRLEGIPGIERASGAGAGITYHHLVFDAHEIVLAEGAASESLYPGPMAWSGLTDEARRELSDLFPDRVPGATAPILPARPIPRGGRQRQLVLRHRKNDKPLFARA